MKSWFWYNLRAAAPVLDSIIVRVIFVLLFSVGAIFFRPEGREVWAAGLLGAALSGITILLEMRMKRMNLKRWLGLAAGMLTGLLCAALVSFVLGHLGSGPAVQFSQFACLLVFAFAGGTVGVAKGELLHLSVFGGEAPATRNQKILDTSVVIDGRIADIVETGFLDGVLVIPQFVLRELQMVADSADSMKRNRGRRGLDVLQRIQKMSQLQVQIVEDDFPAVKDVDMKLIELAKLYNCKIVTNDFNLNKVAQLRGVEVLNINELANSLKPIVLPGEQMRVFILKEGKEYNQGVAYLDDGTMVVVDNARRMISKTIDVTVTSVLQTTAGKMIFGKYDERIHSSSVPSASVPTERTGGAVAGDRTAAAGAAGIVDRSPRREQAVGEN